MSVNNAIQAYVAQRAGETLKAFSYEGAALGPWDILIEITHCGICHSDIHLLNNDWGFTKYPIVPGHEIIGFIREQGELVNEFALGQRVGIGWQRSSCQICDFCHKGEENLCLKQEATCVGHHGGFAKKIVADSRLSFAIPKELTSENAAPLLCGGATVYSPIKHHAHPSMCVGVVGIGGLGHLALQFAAAYGCEVHAFSSSPDKEEEARGFGANHFISSRDKQALEACAHSIDLLLCTTSESVDWQAFLSTLAPKGKLVMLGVPKEGHVDLPIFSLIDGRKTVCGSNIGSVPDIREMLAFAARHDIVAKTEIFPMAEVNRALEKVAANQVKYRAVLEN